MCLSVYDQNSTAGRLRRKAVAAASASAAMAGAPALSFTHGHPIFGAVVIGFQFCLFTVAVGLMVRMKRLPSC